MRVYKFLNKKYGLKALRDKRLHISNIMGLNDPFEFLGVELSDKHKRRKLKRLKRDLSKKRGLLCFSNNWRSPVLWAHYTEKHKGLCLGFDIPDTNKNLLKVRYVKERLKRSKNEEDLNKEFMKKLLRTKFSQWQYEREYRICASLKTQPNGYFNFSSELQLKKIIVGEKSDISRDDIAKALGNNDSNIKIFNAHVAFRKFEMVRQQNKNLWT